jgi:hypothetical protein
MKGEYDAGMKHSRGFFLPLSQGIEGLAVWEWSKAHGRTGCPCRLSQQWIGLGRWDQNIVAVLGCY